MSSWVKDTNTESLSPTPLTTKTRNCIEFCRAEAFWCSILVTRTTKKQSCDFSHQELHCRKKKKKKTFPNLFYRSKLANPIKILTCALSNYAITHFTFRKSELGNENSVSLLMVCHKLLCTPWVNQQSVCHVENPEHCKHICKKRTLPYRR